MLIRSTDGSLVPGRRPAPQNCAASPRLKVKLTVRRPRDFWLGPKPPARIADYDAQISRYRASLDAGGDPAVIARGSPGPRPRR
jgi:hypothetical protein